MAYLLCYIARMMMGSAVPFVAKRVSGSTIGPAAGYFAGFVYIIYVCPFEPGLQHAGLRDVEPLADLP